MAETEVKDLSVEQAMAFDPNQKKKKKKKKSAEAPVDAEVDAAAEGIKEVSVGDAGPATQVADEAAEAAEAADAPEGAAGAVPAGDLTLDFGKKKKKKKPGKVKFGGEEDLMAPKAAENGEMEGHGMPWDGSDRDYEYQELIQRAFAFLQGKNAGNEPRKTFRSRPPQVKKEGKKKTLILNFTDICKGYRRQPEHLLAYLSAELGTTGSLQSNGSLVIKGNFIEAGIEGVLKRYIKEYVACGSCHSPDTVLIRDANTRLYFLQCESCGASRSVAGIRQGYMAQIGRRKHG